MSTAAKTIRQVREELSNRIDEIDTYLGGDLQRASIRDQHTLYLLLLLEAEIKTMSEAEAVALWGQVTMWGIVAAPRNVLFQDFDKDGKGSSKLITALMARELT